MEKVLARVGGVEITEADVTEFLAGLGQRGASYDNPQGRRLVLEQLIGNKLLLLDARRNLFEADPAFKAELARLKETLLVNFAAEKAVSGVKITDSEVEKYYEDNKDKFESGESVNASHILVDSEEKALEILKKIESGEVSFEDAAKEFSSCPSGERGGELGDFTRGQMVPEFDSAVFAMSVGEITSTPVKTQFGYHIIRLNSKNESTLTPLAQIKDKLSDMLLSEKRQSAYESKINQLKIMYPVDML
ncbi:MAG: peptidylprolyl isomerase [Clostridia bacterium]|nr:peptidylprolyl isomerase [Clostridia bacterium]